MQKAAELFRKKGYAATTMRDLAREVGIEAASLYNHISSKQLILSELLLSIADDFTIGMKEIMASSKSSIDKLEALIELHIDITVKNVDSISLIPNEWIHLEEPALKNFIVLRDAYENDFKKIIAQAMEEGDLKKMDLDIILFSILSTLRWLYSWYSKHNEKSVPTLKRDLVLCLIHGLK